MTSPKSQAARPSVPRPPQATEARVKELALAIASAGLDRKARNVEIIDVRGKVDYTDYVVVMSGTSDRQVNAIAKGVENDLKNDYEARAIGSEGQRGGQWVLLDFGDVVVHVFHEDVRGYYDLETLWVDASRLDVPGQAPANNLDFGDDEL